MTHAHDYAHYPSAEAHKLLSDNRERYIAQSAATVAGRAAPFPSRCDALSPVAAAGFSLQPSAATVTPGLAASLTAQPQFFHGSRHPSSSPATCASPPPMAAALYDPDSMDVTSDNEPELPWDGFEADPVTEIPAF